MSPLVIHNLVREGVRIPPWVTDLASFRRWARSDEFPEQGWYSHLNGELWVDLSMERAGHNRVKTEIAVGLGLLLRQNRTGEFFGDRMRLTHIKAALSTEPDGMFYTFEALESRRVRLTEGEDALEVEGSPDMVLEVVSPSSEEKDTVVLRDLYWRARIREYWLVDPRGTEVAFDILRHGRKGYVAARKQDGWVRSAVFDRSFHLTRRLDEDDRAIYRFQFR